MPMRMPSLTKRAGALSEASTLTAPRTATTLAFAGSIRSQPIGNAMRVPGGR
ncbi:hypothetical protein D3C71_2073910 [compost metagenome]